MRILTVYLPTKMLIYIEGKEKVKFILAVTNKDANFQYRKVGFSDGSVHTITAPAIFEEK